MATLVITSGALSNTKTISAGDVTRVLNAAKLRFGQVSDGSGGMRDRTNQELFDLICSMWHAALKDLVLTVETDTARKTVPDLAIT